MKTKKRVITVVHEDDLEEFLSSAGMLEDALSGRLVCGSCQKKMKLEQISRFIMHRGEIVVICDQPSCHILEASEDATD